MKRAFSFIYISLFLISSTLYGADGGTVSLIKQVAGWAFKGIAKNTIDNVVRSYGYNAQQYDSFKKLSTGPESHGVAVGVTAHRTHYKDTCTIEEEKNFCVEAIKQGVPEYSIKKLDEAICEKERILSTEENTARHKEVVKAELHVLRQEKANRIPKRTSITFLNTMDTADLAKNQRILEEELKEAERLYKEASKPDWFGRTNKIEAQVALGQVNTIEHMLKNVKDERFKRLKHDTLHAAATYMSMPETHTQTASTTKITQTTTTELAPTRAMDVPALTLDEITATFMMPNPEDPNKNKKTEGDDPRSRGKELGFSDKPGQRDHMFRREGGHFEEFTPEVEELINTAYKEGKLVGVDPRSGKSTYTWNYPVDGNQVWVEVMGDGSVSNCGANKVEWLWSRELNKLKGPAGLPKEVRGVNYGETTVIRDASSKLFEQQVPLVVATHIAAEKMQKDTASKLNKLQLMSPEAYNKDAMQPIWSTTVPLKPTLPAVPKAPSYTPSYTKKSSKDEKSDFDGGSWEYKSKNKGKNKPNSSIPGTKIWSKTYVIGNSSNNKN